MDNKFYSLTILGGSEPMIQQYAVNSILSCNEETYQYGLLLTVEQAHALVLSRNQSLKASGRIELGGGVIEKLIQSFAGSPYITPENYEETLHRLIDIFYSFKSDTWESVSDDQLIEFMKDAFDGSCRGCLELLELLAQKCDEWNRGEISSLPAEKAQDILTSIMYVISLARKEQSAPAGFDADESDSAADIVQQDSVPVSQLFERGLVCVQKKLFSCHMLQRRILKNIFNTPNVFYRSTIAGGISGFFKLYSPQFSAHEIHITADYPVCLGRPELEGVEFIEEYLSRIDAENAFCRLFDSMTVHRLLLELSPDYAQLPVNVFEPVLLAA